MKVYGYLLFLAIILLSTKILGIATKKIHLPQVVGALLAGIILGPSCLGLIEITDFIKKTAEIGVIMLMFTAGIDTDMKELSRKIADVFAENGAKSEMVMSAPAWQEDQQSAFLQLTSDTFQDVLGWRPRMVAMHFVLEAGFFVDHYPGIQIASIGPRIVEPHSTSERVELKTIEDIWQVLIELLKRLAD